MTKDIQTENGDSEFQVRLLKDEGIGLLTTKENNNYLILDSLHYWYDVIQREYPKKQKCSCKNEWFNVQFVYIIRNDSDDVREIKIITICTNCRKISMRAAIDIDYSPTDKLITNPITYCEKPNIKYKYSELTAYWTKKDLDSFLHFVINELKLNAYYWYFKQSEKIRVFESATLNEAIERNGIFLNLYLTNEELEKSQITKHIDEQGIYIKRDIWRRREIIKISIINMYRIGPLYYITFCNQYIDKGEVKNKSKQFEMLTSQLKDWLKENFINERGKSCFDGKEGYQKYLDKK